MGVLLKHGKVLGWVSALCCDPVSGGPKMGSRLALQTQLCNLASTLQNKSCMAPMFGGVDHVLGPIIQIWKSLGPMCFWSHGQLFSGNI